MIGEWITRWAGYFRGGRIPDIEGPIPGRIWPLAALADGRTCRVTSAYRTSDRPTHDGIDLFYRYLDSDPVIKPGDGGSVIKAGKRHWWIPRGTVARATESGRVQLAGWSRTGWRVWLAHACGLRSGYFHLATMIVRPGDFVGAGAALGRVGDNPADTDATHLHFELSPIDRYAPIDPTRYLASAEHLTARQARWLDSLGQQSPAGETPA